MKKAKPNTTNTMSFLSPPAIGPMFHERAKLFWREQDEIVDDMRRFADDWCARRHAGTKAAMKCAATLTDGATPAEMLSSWSEWMSGAWSRMAEDMREQTQLTMAIAQKLSIANGGAAVQLNGQDEADADAKSRGATKSTADE